MISLVLGLTIFLGLFTLVEFIIKLVTKAQNELLEEMHRTGDISDSVLEKYLD